MYSRKRPDSHRFMGGSSHVLCAGQPVNVFGVLSREYPRDYVLIAVRSALRNFCRSHRVIYSPFELQSFGFLRIHTFMFVFCMYCNIVPPEVSTYWRDV